MRRVLRWPGAAALLTLACSTSAHASPSPAERAAAQTLFDGALAAMKDGNLAEACPKLEESQRLDPATGTRFQLAKCYEAQGRIATAWIQYVDVADAAKAAGQAERETVARARASALAPRLPRLQIDVAPASRGAEIRRDADVVGSGQWGTPFPADPGKHVVRARLSGRKPFEQNVELVEGQVARVVVPELAIDTQALPPSGAASDAPRAAPAESGLGPRKVTALVVGGAGVVALGVGALLGLSAKSKYDDVGADCVGDRCDQAGYDARRSAIKTANAGSVVGGIGLAAVATGAVLWVLAPRDGGSSVGVSVGPSAVRVGGTF